MMYWGFHSSFSCNYQFNKEWIQLCLGHGDQQAGILLIPVQALDGCTFKRWISQESYPWPKASVCFQVAAVICGLKLLSSWRTLFDVVCTSVLPCLSLKPNKACHVYLLWRDRTSGDKYKEKAATGPSGSDSLPLPRNSDLIPNPFPKSPVAISGCASGVA